jgi:Flp pilus assembly protein TadG
LVRYWAWESLCVFAAHSRVLGVAQMAGFLSCIRILRRPDAARQGTTAVEFALLSPVIFFGLMALTEFGLMIGAQQLLENAAFNASRLAKTGYAAAGQTQAQTVNQILVNELSSYGTLINSANVTMTEADYGSFSSASGGGGASGYGASGQIVAYTITYPWKTFTPMICSAFGSACNAQGYINLNSTIVVKNEPYG